MSRCRLFQLVLAFAVAVGLSAQAIAQNVVNGSTGQDRSTGWCVPHTGTVRS